MGRDPSNPCDFSYFIQPSRPITDRCDSRAVLYYRVCCMWLRRCSATAPWRNATANDTWLRSVLCMSQRFGQTQRLLPPGVTGWIRDPQRPFTAGAAHGWLLRGKFAHGAIRTQSRRYRVIACVDRQLASLRWNLLRRRRLACPSKWHCHAGTLY